MSESFTWNPLTPFAARVDLDLTGDIPEFAIDELRSLWDEHHLLYFADQRLSSADQLRVSGWFGPLLDQSKEAFISVDPQLGGAGLGRLAFHSDLACSPHPLLGLSLYALDVTDNATSTVFVDVVAAAASLPDPLRQRLEGLHVMLLWPLSFSGDYSYEHRWCNGDFIIWDNIALQHGRPDPPPGIRRTLRRVELSEHGYAELVPPQVAAAYQMT